MRLPNEKRAQEVPSSKRALTFAGQLTKGGIPMRAFYSTMITLLAVIEWKRAPNCANAFSWADNETFHGG